MNKIRNPSDQVDKDAPDEGRDVRDTLTVFVSYARSDRDIADALVNALNGNDIEALIDRRNLPYGEEWQAELMELISRSDAVLWLVSPQSIESRWCKWELEAVTKLKKRLFPILITPETDTKLPDQLARVQILPSEGYFLIERHLPVLLSALTTDTAWLKEHTRLLERATQWATKGRPPALLLRGVSLKEAEHWRATQPAVSPGIPEPTQAFLLASRNGASRRLRYWIVALFSSTAITTLLALVAYSKANLAQSNALQAMHTLALSDNVKASQQATHKPSQALAYLARALRNYPEQTGIARQLLNLVAGHTYAIPLERHPQAMPALVKSEPIEMRSESWGTVVGERAESPDRSWSVLIDHNGKIYTRESTERIWRAVATTEAASYYSWHAAFPRNPRYVALVGGYSNEYFQGGVIHVVSKDGTALGTMALGGVQPTSVALSPNGRVLVVGLSSTQEKDGEKRTILCDLRPMDENADGNVRVIEITETRAFPGDYKVFFSADGSYLVLNGEWWRLVSGVADEPLGVKSPDRVMFSKDSSKMAIEDDSGSWSYIDTKLGVSAAAPSMAKSSFTVSEVASTRASRIGGSERDGHRAGGKEHIDLGEDIMFLARSPDKDQLLWFRSDGTVNTTGIGARSPGRLWHTLEALYALPADAVQSFKSGAQGETGPALQGDDDRVGEFAAVFQGQGSVWKLWRVNNRIEDTRIRDLLRPLTGSEPGGAGWSVAVHPNRKLLAVARNSHSSAVVNLIDVTKNRKVMNSIVPDAFAVDVFFSRQGDWLGVAGSNAAQNLGDLAIIDITTGFRQNLPTIRAGPFIERPDGKRIVALGRDEDNYAVIFDVLGDTTVAPLWAADLAEGVAGWHLDEQNVLRTLTPHEQHERVEGVRKALQKVTGTADRWEEFGRWYLSDGPGQLISPYSTMTLASRDSRLSQLYASPKSERKTDGGPLDEAEMTIRSGEQARQDTISEQVTRGSSSDTTETGTAFLTVVGSMTKQPNAVKWGAEVAKRAQRLLDGKRVEVKESVVANKRVFRVVIQPPSDRVTARNMCTELAALQIEGCFLEPAH